MIFRRLFPIDALVIGATAITSTSCYDKSDLVECCQSVEPANSTLISEKGIQAGDLASNKSVGFNCTKPEGDVVEGTSQCESRSSIELCCGHELFIANDVQKVREWGPEEGVVRTNAAMNGQTFFKGPVNACSSSGQDNALNRIGTGKRLFTPTLTCGDFVSGILLHTITIYPGDPHPTSHQIMPQPTQAGYKQNDRRILA
ncbi:hypothetical protein F5146DRAFT_1006689 [Armillaria mellea]|nr:hypothetical protein F5146DRAFT_1006689 [Armillaria mellea]